MLPARAARFRRSPRARASAPRTARFGGRSDARRDPSASAATQKPDVTIATDCCDDPRVSSFVDYVFRPTERELEHPVPIDGRLLPEGFPAGTYLRNGPNARFGANFKDHLFDGDGMVHGVSIDGSGSAKYFCRYVNTKGFARESRAGRRLYEGVLQDDGWRMLGGLLKNAISQSGELTKDTANTGIVSHGGKILALMEAQRPARMRLDAEGRGILTETAEDDYDSQLLHNLTAHPKIDPRTGHMICFGYQMESKPHMWYSEIDAKGKIVHSVGVRNLNRGVMAHDMAITASRAILFDLPITFDLTRVLLSGETPVQFVKDAPARIGIMPRGGSQVKWIDIARRGNVFHTFNAYDDPTTGEIVLHGLRSEPRKSGWIFNDYAPSFLHEWVINEGKGTVQERRLGNIAGEFPCVNPNFVGRKAEYGYMLVDGVMGSMSSWRFPPIGVVYNGLLKYRLETGEVLSRVDVPEGFYLFEPCFVPRDSAAGGEGAQEEDDGFLVAFACDAAKEQSYLVVGDAKNLEAGFRMLAIPHKVAAGLHGCFIPHQD